MLKEIIPFKVTPEDGNFELVVWKPEGEVKAVVQILHGMAEHIDRYEGLAKALTDQGYAVAGHSHKGHGRTCGQNELGFFYEQDGWNRNVENAHFVSALIREQFEGKKFVLLGHSMGSFMAREYAIRYSNELDGLVLCGTGSPPFMSIFMGKLLAQLSPLKKPAHLVDKIAFVSYNTPFKPNRTKFDWLSRDEKEVDKYIEDELCGFCFTGGAFRDFFGGLMALSKLDRLNSMNKFMPVYFISGDCDPVGGMGKGVVKAYEQFKNVGIQDVTIQLYKGARHELFNETNKQEVMMDLIDWLHQKIQ